MDEDIRTGKRELVARVATLELLVADLVDMLWRLDPEGMERLGHDAERDLELQHNRTALPAAEHMRERLFAVLESRRRTLNHHRRGVGKGAKAADSPASRG